MFRSAAKEGYFRISPVDDVEAKANPSKYLKEFLEAEDYIQLLSTPLVNNEIRKASVVSSYSELRWCDIKALRWQDIGEDGLTSQLVQKKAKKPLVFTQHPIVRSILNKKREALSEAPIKDRVFNIGTANCCNKAIKNGCKAEVSTSISLGTAHG